MILENTILIDSKISMLIEEKSKVVQDSIIIMGTEKNLSDTFY